MRRNGAKKTIGMETKVIAKSAPREGKRKRIAKVDTENKVERKPAPRAKKARTTKPQEEPDEYLEKKRNLQDLWKAAFPVGTEWNQFDALYEPNWDFRHLEEALEEGGMLYGNKVFIFVNSEPQLVAYKGVVKLVHVPTVIAIQSSMPPSDKIAIPSNGEAADEIIPMKQMKLDWVPYIPFEKRQVQIDRMKFQTFIMVCTQRRAALRHLKDERVRKYHYCLPYFYDPFNEVEHEHEEEMSEDAMQAFQNMIVYKFYPQPSPDISGVKRGATINRYYRNAHQVL